ncbi:hypothetical protein CORC01_11681 [Colletotrichum orchidophilum]|uniref:Uncharacterized protein n=1 Tax=Colletotrichum orchidophilum TaxID=1209926 RepID=A0A1G4AVG6_9PEZI|nr:uncharacterized protein CORC01_11681 [Colletotrichum orchidophilum]OHE93042.1 hypothetical protein CORC01_11681 [Colletotrichum orchidophilum]
MPYKVEGGLMAERPHDDLPWAIGYSGLCAATSIQSNCNDSIITCEKLRPLDLTSASAALISRRSLDGLTGSAPPGQAPLASPWVLGQTTEAKGASQDHW